MGLQGYKTAGLVHPRSKNFVPLGPQHLGDSEAGPSCTVVQDVHNRRDEKWMCFRWCHSTSPGAGLHPPAAGIGKQQPMS